MSNFWWLSLTFSCGNSRYLHWKAALLELYIKPVPVANSVSLASSSRKSKKKRHPKMQIMKFLLAILITLGLEFGVKAKVLQIHNHPLYQKYLESGNFWSLKLQAITLTSISQLRLLRLPVSPILKIQDFPLGIFILRQKSSYFTTPPPSSWKFDILLP